MDTVKVILVVEKVPYIWSEVCDDWRSLSFVRPSATRTPTGFDPFQFLWVKNGRRRSLCCFWCLKADETCPIKQLRALTFRPSPLSMSRQYLIILRELNYLQFMQYMALFIRMSQTRNVSKLLEVRWGSVWKLAYLCFTTGILDFICIHPLFIYRCRWPTTNPSS